eukprot:1040383-Prorocentrum_minimum.AAC.1
MKFGATLEQGLVPEWRGKYVDYKLLKKLLKVRIRPKCMRRYAQSAVDARTVSNTSQTRLPRCHIENVKHFLLSASLSLGNLQMYQWLQRKLEGKIEKEGDVDHWQAESNELFQVRSSQPQHLE